MAFDELFDRSKVRPIYRNYFDACSKRTPAEQKAINNATRACIHGDADFLPLARLMSEREYRDIVKGVRQRGRAIRLFLVDHFFGSRSYESAGVFKRGEIETILQRYPVSPDASSLRKENIQFWYGPDLMRDEKGVLRVIEDNIGFVGGIGDLYAFADATKVLGAPIAEKHHPRSFYKAMVAAYKREASKCGGGKVILLSYAKARRLNHEDERLERILENFGVESVSDFRKLKLRGDGLYHGRQRVGFVIVYVDPEEIDPSDSSSYRIAGFWKGASEGLYGISYSPQFEFVGDKKFCARVEALVQHYLGETCLLPTMKTLSLDDPRSLREVRDAREQWVIKLGRGQSGESVWLGRGLNSKQWTSLMKRVAKRPSDFIAQKFFEPSQFLGHTVDLRPLALINAQGEHVSPIPWARAAALGKGKTNISKGGLLAPVAIIRGTEVAQSNEHGSNRSR